MAQDKRETMTTSSVVHTLFHWIGMIAAVGMVLLVPFIWSNSGSHGQTMGGGIGAAMAPVIFWFLLALVVFVALIVSCIAAGIANDPPELRKPCWLPFVVALGTSTLFWAAFLLNRG